MPVAAFAIDRGWLKYQTRPHTGYITVSQCLICILVALNFPHMFVRTPRDPITYLSIGLDTPRGLSIMVQNIQPSLQMVE